MRWQSSRLEFRVKRKPDPSHEAVFRSFRVRRRKCTATVEQTYKDAIQSELDFQFKRACGFHDTGISDDEGYDNECDE